MTVSQKNIDDTFFLLKNSAQKRVLLPIGARREALKKLLAGVIANESRFFAALKDDLGRSSFETYITEVSLIKQEVHLALKSLNAWSKARAVATPLVFQPGCSYIEPMPKGLVLIIAPWNYPLQLSLLPLISAIAAGNCAILKPSEHAPASLEALMHVVNDHLDNECFRVIPGDAKTAQALLSLPFDHIFYTGGAEVAREVLKKAAVNLTPTTLELGGKSPCIVDETANLKLAVKRIWWAKCLNAGQTCIAPDYVLLKNSIKDDFIALSKDYLDHAYKEGESQNSFGRIVNERHVMRLTSYLQGGRVVYGGRSDVHNRFMEPTLIDDVDVKSPLMQEEIFGPILPLVGVKSIDEAIDFVNERPHPLALYLFSEDDHAVMKVKTKTTSGGLCINECISHGGILSLPFGGAGASGMGNYHGKFGFDTFSHLRAVHKRANVLDNPIKYPPYSDQKLKIARLVM